MKQKKLKSGIKIIKNKNGISLQTTKAIRPTKDIFVF